MTSSGNRQSRIYYSKFAVGEVPYCVWDWDLPTQNKQYLDSIDSGFFLHVAQAHAEILDRDEGEACQCAALALRLFYGHAFETLLSLLAAAVQAPDCIFGWLAQYREPHLRVVLEALSMGRPLKTKLNLTSPTWEGLSELVHSFINLEDLSKTQRIRQSYADFWAQAAWSHLNQRNHHEFNSIKHGLRARSGGYTLRMVQEKSPGVPDPDAEVHTVASSRFGSSFLLPERIEGNKRHLAFKRESVNWHPQSLVTSIQLVSSSVKNIVAFLKINAGEDPQSVEFGWPADLASFDLARQGAPGSEASSFGSLVRAEHIKDFSKDEILSIYNARRREESTNSNGA